MHRPAEGCRNRFRRLKRTGRAVDGPEHLEHGAHLLSGRPYETLTWNIPAEKMRALILTSSSPAGATILRIRRSQPRAINAIVILEPLKKNLVCYTFCNTARLPIGRVPMRHDARAGISFKDHCSF